MFLAGTYIWIGTVLASACPGTRDVWFEAFVPMLLQEGVTSPPVRFLPWLPFL